MFTQLLPLASCPLWTQIVLAACHSLVHVDGSLVGDPVEQLALREIDWNFGRGIGLVWI